MLGLKLKQCLWKGPLKDSPVIFRIAPLSLSPTHHTDWVKHFWLNFCCDQILCIMFYKLDSMTFILSEMIINYKLGYISIGYWVHDMHYDDVIMGAIASQITSLTIVYSTVYSGADQSKNQSPASLAFVWGIHRGPVNSPHKWPVTRKMFPFDDVIMAWNIVQTSITLVVLVSHCSDVTWASWRLRSPATGLIVGFWKTLFVTMQESCLT